MGTYEIWHEVRTYITNKGKNGKMKIYRYFIVSQAVTVFSIRTYNSNRKKTDYEEVRVHPNKIFSFIIMVYK